MRAFHTGRQSTSSSSCAAVHALHLCFFFGKSTQAYQDRRVVRLSSDSHRPPKSPRRGPGGGYWAPIRPHVSSRRGSSSTSLGIHGLMWSSVDHRVCVKTGGRAVWQVDLGRGSGFGCPWLDCPMISDAAGYFLPDCGRRVEAMLTLKLEGWTFGVRSQSPWIGSSIAGDPK
jgi:hypothetical protein